MPNSTVTKKKKKKKKKTTPCNWQQECHVAVLYKLI